MRNEDFVSVAKTIFVEKFSDAACAFVAGSIVTGHGTPLSDIDIIILYNDNSHETYRASLRREGWPIELFVHNIQSQNYFFKEDASCGECSTLMMIASGIVIGNIELAQSRKNLANELIVKGPDLWSKEAVDRRRYGITDSLDDLLYPKDKDYIPGIISQLFAELGNFYLRAQGKWSGTGKQLIKALKQNNPVFAEHFLAAFDAAWKFNNTPIQDLCDEVLKPYGGFLFDNYKSVMPQEKWNDQQT